MRYLSAAFAVIVLVSLSGCKIDDITRMFGGHNSDEATMSRLARGQKNTDPREDAH